MKVLNSDTLLKQIERKVKWQKDRIGMNFVTVTPAVKYFCDELKKAGVYKASTCEGNVIIWVSWRKNKTDIKRPLIGVTFSVGAKFGSDVFQIHHFDKNGSQLSFSSIEYSNMSEKEMRSEFKQFAIALSDKIKQW